MLNVTPTQRAAIDRRNAFIVKITQTAEARRRPKIIPINAEHDVAAPVPVTFVWGAVPNYRTNIEFAPESKKRRTVPNIISATAAHFQMSADELLSDRRHHYLVRPRHIAMYISYVHTMQSLQSLGRKFGGRDHTTILHGVRSIQNLILFRNAEVLRDVDAVCDLLYIKL